MLATLACCNYYESPQQSAAALDSDGGFLWRKVTLTWIVGPRYAPWCRRGAWIGAAVGIVLGASAYAYFAYGASAGTPDAWEAYGYVGGILGLPFSFVGEFAGAPGLVLSAAAAWAVLGALVAGVVGLVRTRVKDA